MRQRLIVVGRGEPALAGYEQRFIERIRHFAPLDVLELTAGRERRPEQRRQRECAWLRKQISGSVSVLFDERGREISSQDWAGFLRAQVGNAVVSYVIGGAGGVEPELRSSVDHCWQLSRLTLPHQLARTLVLEQLYRAHTIVAGHPYHRA